jgi:phenylpropionate dioxygenase-like ring-hydroxylating dioxygenase large terminal subunit
VDKIPQLPLNKTVVEVFADFLAYLLDCASSFIQETHANGTDLWESVKDDIHFVLSHPNGWEGPQQVEMRKASVLAKLIPDTAAGHARVSFVTEGEASLHYAVHNSLPIGVMDDGEGVVIVDAGGGTIDISSYSKNVGEAKHGFEEVASPRCNYLFPQL